MQPRSHGLTRWAAPIAIAVCFVLCARAAVAHSAVVPIPDHLVIGNQYFASTPAGFRSYLETIKTSNPDLFARLAPDADRLVERVTLGRILMIGGLAAGVATAIYGFASVSDCVAPQITDPNFATDSSAWGACNDHNMTRRAAFAGIGTGLVVAGMIGWVAVSPSREDLLELVNRNNRLSPQPLQLQLDYDPLQRLARAGATLTF